MAARTSNLHGSAHRQAGLGKIRIGNSGWRYKGWRGVFYPPRLAQRRELEYAASRFGTVEINGTFYSLQRPAYFRQWASQVPEDFVFAVKGPRFVTHMLKLRNADQPLANFFGSGLLDLGHRLGPILWQVPPMLRFDAERFAEFFEKLPRTHAAMASLSRGHAERFAGRMSMEIAPGVKPGTPVRHCLEIRHESFAVPEFVKLLRAHNIGLVVADTVDWPLLMDVTADFIYCRLHGSEELYASGYESDALDVWADRIAAWAQGGAAPLGGQARRACTAEARCRPRDVYVYFDNDAKVRAPFDALALQSKVQDRLPANSASGDKT
jgi:uncharacterized protein YecE (DUF72 family)